MMDIGIQNNFVTVMPWCNRQDWRQ